jgi:HD-like signal output (HDOD) protein
MDNPSPYTQAVEPMPVDTIAAVLLLDLFRDPDHDIDGIVEFISNDPLLTAETLKRCNQSSFRGTERTTDIFEAVNRLGFYELYDIIAASIGVPAPGPNARMSAELEAFQNFARAPR